jgi:TctA family transporter
VLKVWKEMPRYWVTLLRSSAIGCWLGITPGGAIAASFMGYNLAKRFSKDPSSFGKGRIEGVFAPETAAHASGTSALLPMLALGIPGSGTAAILLGGLMVWGLNPRTASLRRAQGLRLGTDRVDVPRQRRRAGHRADHGADFSPPSFACRSRRSRR